jgi:hypothetical protein
VTFRGGLKQFERRLRAHVNLWPARAALVCR